MTALESLAGRRAYLDANVFIYALNAFPQFAAILGPLFAAIDVGGVAAVTSELTVAEMLVKPLRDADTTSEAACRAILYGNPRLTVAPVTRDVLIEAARLRARSNLRMPDAIHAATAVLHSCDVLLTNDGRFRDAGVGVGVVLLPELTL